MGIIRAAFKHVVSAVKEVIAVDDGVDEVQRCSFPNCRDAGEYEHPRVWCTRHWREWWDDGVEGREVSDDPDAWTAWKLRQDKERK